MKVEVETLDNNMARLTVEVESSELDKAITKAYRRVKNRINVPGFRKGKVPQVIVEKMYGPDMFYEDAANYLIEDNYPKAYEESGLDIVSQPEVDVEQIEKGKPFIFTAEVATKPEVKLGEYKGVKVKKESVEATEEDIDQEIENEQKRNSRIVTIEGEASKGDTVVIDYEGFHDGEAFEGGKAEHYSLELGSDSFIPGFEDQLVGAEAGDDIQVNVTFPEEYHAPDLAGEDATFIVHVHEVRRREVPEIDDEYIEDAGFDSMEEYREDLRETIEKRKTDEVRRRQEDEAIAKIVEDCEMDIPEPMIDTQTNAMLNEYANNVINSGIPFQQYLQMTGMTTDQLRDQMRPDAEERIKSSLMLEAVAKAENVEITEADIDEKIAEAAKMYNMTVEDFEKNMPEDERDNVKNQLTIERAIDIIMENTEEVEED